MYVFMHTFAVPTACSEDIQRIRDAIKNASSLQEVERLTRILQSGNIPENLNAENGHGNGKTGMQLTFDEVNSIFICILGNSHEEAMEM